MGGAGPNQLQRHANRNGYYDRKIGAVNLKPGDLVLVKADAWKGKEED